MNPRAWPDESVSLGDAEAALLVAEIKGDFDLVVADRLREPLLQAVAQTAPVVAFDLCECTYIDSAALGLIADAQDLAHRQSGAVALICPEAPHPALVPLRFSKLDERIQLFPNREVFDAFVTNVDGRFGTRKVWKSTASGDLVTAA